MLRQENTALPQKVQVVHDFPVVKLSEDVLVFFQLELNLLRVFPSLADGFPLKAA